MSTCACCFAANGSVQTIKRITGKTVLLCPDCFKASRRFLEVIVMLGAQKLHEYAHDNIGEAEIIGTQDAMYKNGDIHKVMRITLSQALALCHISWDDVGLPSDPGSNCDRMQDYALDVASTESSKKAQC